MPSIDDLLAEARRQTAVCNGCRYCEGYCAVFPALERLPLLEAGDLGYLANLCHDCRACYQACMYTPPHEFGIEIPQLMSASREASYERYARPRWLARAFAQGPASIAALTLAGIVVYVLLAWAAGTVSAIVTPGAGPRAFYDVVPYALMLVPGLLLSLFVLLVMGAGLVAFWRETSRSRLPGPAVVAAACREVLTMRWLGGGGGGCYWPEEEAPSQGRRVLHQLLGGGFLLALASTTLAAVFQDLLGQEPPFPLLHPVVLLGTAGGLGMVVGATGLLWLRRRAAALGSAAESRLNTTFLVALDAASLSGLALLAFRGTPAMGGLLILHLGTLAALYLTAPYGKAVHTVYRFGALLRSAAERRAR